MTSDREESGPIHRNPRFLRVRIVTAVVLFVVSVIMFSFGFYCNQWKAAKQEWFDQFQRDSESRVVGRLAKSRQDGIFSSSGMIGRFVHPTHPNRRTKNENQYRIYENHLSTEGKVFNTYNSQIGFQGITFSLLDKFTDIQESTFLNCMRFATSILLAIVLSVIVLWFFLEFGFVSAVIVLLTILYSHWITVFGRNLWWVLWSFYLPFLASLHVCNRSINKKIFSAHYAFLITFLAVFVKCLYTGYEYITTTLLMMLVPYLYYGVADSVKFKDMCKRIFLVSLSSVFAFLTTTMILSFQIMMESGSFKKGLFYIFVYSFGKRTHGDPSQYPYILTRSLKADTFDVLSTYFDGVAMNLNNVFGTESTLLVIHYNTLVYFFGGVSLLAVIYGMFSKRISGKKRKLFALMLATWFSILAPISWFTIFKAHSEIHVHMNFITWHMPFTFFGFALTGFLPALFVGSFFAKKQ